MLAILVTESKRYYFGAEVCPKRAMRSSVPNTIFDHRRSNSDAAPGYGLVIGIQPVKLVGICHPRNLKRLLPQEKPFGQFAVHADCPGDKFEAFGVKTRRKRRGGALFVREKSGPANHRAIDIHEFHRPQPASHFHFAAHFAWTRFPKRATNDSDNAKYASQPACVNGSICSFQTARPAKSSAVGPRPIRPPGGTPAGRRPCRPRSSRRPAADRVAEGDFAARLRFAFAIAATRPAAVWRSVAVEKQTFRPKIGPRFAVEDNSGLPTMKAWKRYLPWRMGRFLEESLSVRPERKRAKFASIRR